jgi:hypothetical protein
MAARFSGSVETGRGWGGRPEQARVWINNTLTRTLLLGFDKANLVSTGFTATTGKRRPERFKASVKPLIYDLSDPGQLQALQVTWRHLIAYAAGFKQQPGHQLYRLNLGQDREISRIEYQEGKYEVLRASCYNRNVHTSEDPRLFAWDQDVRQFAWEEHQRRYPVVRDFCFQIIRVDRDGHRIHVANRGDRYELPFAAVEQLAPQIERLLRETWLYIQQHPEQVLLRHDLFEHCEWLTRWQLYEPRPLEALMGPALKYTFEYAAEPALFTRPELYQQSFERLDQEGRFSPEYLERLQLLANRELRWVPEGPVSRQQVELDLSVLHLSTLVPRVEPQGWRPALTEVRWHALEEPNLPATPDPVAAWFAEPAEVVPATLVTLAPVPVRVEAAAHEPLLYWLTRVFQRLLWRLITWICQPALVVQAVLATISWPRSLPRPRRYRSTVWARGPPRSAGTRSAPRGVLFFRP